MKASEEIAADQLISQAIKANCETKKEIIDYVKDIEDSHRGGESVGELLENDNSSVWERFEEQIMNFCEGCGQDMLFDSNNDEFYCPVCDV